MGDKLIEIYDNLTEEIEKKNLSVDNQQEILSEIIGEIQNNCLKSEFGKIVNSALDVGIRAIFPDVVEDQIINLKDNIYEFGIKEGIGQTVEDIVDFGKSTMGILTNDFESISQAQKAISNGGTLDKISDLLDSGINNLKDSKKIDSNTAKTLKKEKNAILNNIEKNIETSFSNQINNLEKLEKYISNWNKYFESQDFSGMEKEFNKMKKVIDSLLPTENILVDYRTIENLHTLIKNNGKNFELSEEEISLAYKLVH